MNRIFSVLITSILISGCIQKTNHTLIVNDAQLQDYKLLHRFFSKDSMALGDLYGKPVNDSLYSDFKIIKKSEKRNILIYSISTTNFRNTLGKENIPINSENFFGYYVLVLTKMNMDIEPRFKVQGKILKSDPIDIVWDDSKNVFKVLLSP